MACAAGLAALDVYQREGLFTRARELESFWEERAHQLQGASNVIDVRNYGLIAGIELAPRSDAPGQRAFEVFQRCFEAGVLIRVTGDIIALSPPLIISENEIDLIFSTLGDAIEACAREESAS